LPEPSGKHEPNAVKNAKGQEIRWVLEEDFFAHAKETMSPEKYAEIEARYKDWCERHRPKPTVVGESTLTSHVVVPAEMITDPGTGQPRVFTEEEKKKYVLR